MAELSRQYNNQKKQTKKEKPATGKKTEKKKPTSAKKSQGKMLNRDSPLSKLPGLGPQRLEACLEVASTIGEFVHAATFSDLLQDKCFKNLSLAVLKNAQEIAKFDKELTPEFISELKAIWDRADKNANNIEIGGEVKNNKLVNVVVGSDDGKIIANSYKTAFHTHPQRNREEDDLLDHISPPSGADYVTMLQLETNLEYVVTRTAIWTVKQKTNRNFPKYLHPALEVYYQLLKWAWTNEQYPLNSNSNEENLKNYIHLSEHIQPSKVLKPIYSNPEYETYLDRNLKGSYGRQDLSVDILKKHSQKLEKLNLFDVNIHFI